MTVRLTDCHKGKSSPVKNDTKATLVAPETKPTTTSKPMVMLKFVDDSGTDITEKVKEVKDAAVEQVEEERESAKDAIKQSTKEVKEVADKVDEVQKVQDIEELGEDVPELPAVSSGPEYQLREVSVRLENTREATKELAEKLVDNLNEVMEVQEVEELAKEVPEPLVGLEERMKEDFHLEIEDTEEEDGDDGELEILEISQPKVQEVLIVLEDEEQAQEEEEEEERAGFGCILEKVEDSPDKIRIVSVETPGEREGVTVVEVLPQPVHLHPANLSFEEAFSRFTQKPQTSAAPESEVESDVPGKEQEVVGDFSADDEQESGGEGLVLASTAWSSLSTILEPQDSPAKTKMKRRRRKSATKVTPAKKVEVKAKKSPTPESSSKKYRRSSRMSNLLGEATDTDDQSPVRPPSRITKLILAKCSEDEVKCKPKKAEPVVKSPVKCKPKESKSVVAITELRKSPVKSKIKESKSAVAITEVKVSPVKSKIKEAKSVVAITEVKVSPVKSKAKEAKTVVAITEVKKPRASGDPQTTKKAVGRPVGWRGKYNKTPGPALEVGDKASRRMLASPTKVRQEESAPATSPKPKVASPKPKVIFSFLASLCSQMSTFYTNNSVIE